MKYKLGDMVKVKQIKKYVRYSKQKNKSEQYFKGMIGIVEYIGKPRSIVNRKELYMIKFYFDETDTKGLIREIFRRDELGRPSRREMKKFQLFLEKINAKEVAEKL